MFQEEVEKPDTRPTLIVRAPGREFVTKYFDRAFDRRISDTTDEDRDTALPAFIVTAADGSQNTDEQLFVDECTAAGIVPVVLRVLHVIGTGMIGFMMTLARGVARGTMLQIRDNSAELSIVHASDLARAAVAVADTKPAEVLSLTISAPPTPVNDLVSALGVRIKDKRVGTIAPRWARILYGRTLYSELTTSAVVDTSAFAALCPDFVFASPAEYLRTHVYDHDSL